MWATSTEFNRLVRADHRVVVAVEVWDASGPLATLQLTSGQVTVDRTRTIRRDLTAQLVDPTGELSPDDATDLLAPYGNEVRAWRGVRLSSGVDELVPLGVFRASAYKITRNDAGTVIDITGYDRSRRVARNKWATEYVIPASVEAALVLEELLLDRWPDITLDLPNTGQPTGRVVLEAGESSDPWRDAQAIAAAAGYQLAFDPSGVCRMYAPRDPYDTVPDATYTTTSDCVLLDLGREADDEDTYSGVIVTGESSSLTSPVRAEAWDDYPRSPTYRGGPFGEVPKFITSPLVKTAAQAAAMAAAELDGAAGMVQAVNWSQIVHPGHDADDVIQITDPQSATDARLSLDSLTVPLGADQPMTATGRIRSRT